MSEDLERQLERVTKERDDILRTWVGPIPEAALVAHFCFAYEPDFDNKAPFVQRDIRNRMQRMVRALRKAGVLPGGSR